MNKIRNKRKGKTLVLKGSTADLFVSETEDTFYNLYNHDSIESGMILLLTLYGIQLYCISLH